MFKQVTATVLLLAFVAQTFASPFIMLDYYVNTAAYARNCINKNRPKMHCNGQCQMMKKIREQEKKDQQNAEEKAAAKMPVLSSRSFFGALTVPLISSTKILYSTVTGHPVDQPTSLFHPPQV